MTTILVIGAVLLGVLALSYGAYRLARRSGAESSKLAGERDQARAEAVASKAVAEALAQPTTRDDVIRDLESGGF